MNEADRRNLRYLAARLGPIPGWSIGYGYDTENLWASPDELQAWKDFLEAHLGWDHFIGARVGFDEKGLYGRFGKGIPKPPLNEKSNAPVGDRYTAWLGGDYIGYTSYRPLYDRYVEVLGHRPDRPSFEESRFPAEQERIVRLLAKEVVVIADGLLLRVRTNSLQSLVAELEGTTR